MKKFIIALTAISIISCSKEIEYVNDTPSCLDSKIELFKKGVICKDGLVDEYLFEGQTVYVLDPGTCGADFQSEVLDINCNPLGFLGGIIGNTKIEGIDFSSAKFIRNIWKNE